MPTVEINDAVIYYEVHGKGYPLVLSHTGRAGLENWSQVLPGLAEKYQVLVYDRRGCGRSKAPEANDSAQVWCDDLYRLMKHVGMKSAYIGGVSYGAFLTTEFVLAHPEMTGAAMIICGTTLGFGGRPDRIPFPDRRDRLHEITCPVLLLQGAQDKNFPPQLAEVAKRHMTRSPLVEMVTLDCGHSPQNEVPEAFSATLLDFLSKVDKLRGSR